MRVDGRDAGFTLIETLVALVIFVACYLLVHQSVSLGWRGVQVAHTEAAALHLAQGLLTAAGVETPLQDGVQSGSTADGYSWALQIRRQPQPDNEGTAQTLAGYWVAVDVSWPEGPLRRTRSLQLSTFKLRPAT